jgi:hypothetical protein
MKSGNLNFLEPSGPLQNCNGTAVPLPLLKQYVRNKPHKLGMKVFARAGSSGIVYDFEVYVGKGTVKNVSLLSISGDVVLRLVDGLPKGQNYKVFMDN